MNDETNSVSSELGVLQSRLRNLGIVCAVDDLREVAQHLQVLEQMVAQLKDPSDQGYV